MPTWWVVLDILLGIRLKVTQPIRKWQTCVLLIGKVPRMEFSCTGPRSVIPCHTIIRDPTQFIFSGDTLNDLSIIPMQKDFVTVLSYGILITVFTYLVYSFISDIRLLLKYRKCTSNVSTSRLIHEIILFTNDILWKQGISHFPIYKISYYPHKKYLGAFDGKRIFIYVKNVQDVPTLTAVVLHEIRHFIQLEKNVKNYDRYEKYLQLYGYNLHPMEIDCHLFSMKWLYPCLEHLFLKNIIKKEQ